MTVKQFVSADGSSIQSSIRRCFGQDRFTLIVDNLREPDYEIRNLPKGTKNPRQDIRWMFLGFDPRPGQS